MHLRNADRVAEVVDVLPARATAEPASHGAGATTTTYTGNVETLGKLIHLFLDIFFS